VAVPKPSTPRSPVSLASSLVGLQGIFFLVFAVLELINLDSARLTMGATTTLFFAGWGVGLLLCARALRRRQSWARGPIVMAQLIHLMVAWGFRGGSTTWVAVLGIAVSLGVIGLILHPRSIRELAD
jgi:hypothetical protein